MKRINSIFFLTVVMLTVSCTYISKKKDILNANKTISVVSLYPEEGKLFKIATLFNSKEDPFIFKGYEDFNKRLESLLDKKLKEKGYSVETLDTDAIRARVGKVSRGHSFFGKTFESEGDLQGELEKQSIENSVDYFLLVTPLGTDPCFSTTYFMDTYGIINRNLGFNLGSRIFVSVSMVVVPQGSISSPTYSMAYRCVEVPEEWGRLENLEKTISDSEFSEKMYRAMEESYLDAFGHMNF